MKYLKVLLYIGLAFTFTTIKLSGQTENDDNAKLLSAKNNKATILQDTSTADKTNAEQKVNVAFDLIDKEDLQGGIGFLNPVDFINTDYSSSVYDGLNGRISGLWYNNIWGRGGALIMIDGIPRDIGDVRLEEVEQITALKGANAVVLYGNHAANGVILITTKRGITRDKVMNVRINEGIATPKLFPGYLNSADYMTLYNEARVNDGLSTTYDPQQIEYYRSGNSYRYPSIDYYSSEYLKSHFNTTNINADFAAGNKDARFYSNIGWLHNTTLLNVGEGANEKDDRFNARGNVDLRINDFVSSSIDISTIISNSRRGRTNYWGQAATIRPNKYSPLLPIDLINPDSLNAVQLANHSGNIIDGIYILGGTQEYLTNPFADLYASGHDNYIDRVLHLTNGINVNLNSVIDGLSFHTLFNADFYNTYIQSIINQYAVFTPVWDSVPTSDELLGLVKYNDDVTSGIQTVTGSAQTKNLGFRAYFKYGKTYNQVHNVSGLLIANGYSVTTSSIVQPINNANIGLQLAYNYNHKYWANFSGAVVNSTKLPENNRTAFSPTLAFSWLLSEESFLSGADAIDRLKLTLSGGVVNTDNEISNHYQYDNTYVSDRWFSWFDDTYRNRSTTSLQGSNPNLTFSKWKEVFASIDGLFFDKLLSLQTTFFLLKIDGLPTQRFTQYPSYYSTFVPYTNYNANACSGVDFMLNLNKNIGEININLGINGAYTTSKVSKKDELYSNDYQYREGKPVDAIFGLVSEGFFVDNTEIENSPKQAFGEVRPGDIKYVDQNGDDIVDENDEVEIGRWSSPLNYAVNLSVSYRSFTLFIQGYGFNGGNGMKTNDYYWVDGDDKYSVEVLNRWTEETKATATYPRLTSQSSSNNYRYSDFWMYKTNQFRIGRIQLTCDLPSNIIGNSFVKQLGIYINGSNLLTLSKNKDILDLNIASSPQMRYFSAGIRAIF